MSGVAVLGSSSGLAVLGCVRPNAKQPRVLVRAIAEVNAKGGRPYAIPAGASVHKYGGLGYVGFAEEVRTQERALRFAFDYIIVCTVTGSTQTGMLVGFAKDGRARRVIGIDASATPRQTKARVLEIARNTATLVELDQEITTMLCCLGLCLSVVWGPL
jgi:1-aminocyclopropane-1-carboxylate deaminase/D-cysteine desulfhydrase-like pyridoxal-dependent ACC family enzyme